MRLLLDTHILCWAAFDPGKLPAAMAIAIDNPANETLFSVATIWELANKYASGSEEYRYPPRVLRAHALRVGYSELPVTGDHALQMGALPPLHRNPFDRLMIAQAQCEGLILVTVSSVMKQYPDLQLF